MATARNAPARATGSGHEPPLAMVATIGGFLFGFDSGAINGAQAGLALTFGGGEAGTAFSVALTLVGCAAGALAAGRMSHLFGRRGMLRVSALLYLVAAPGSGSAGSSAAFEVHRIIAGLAIGASTALSPAYIAEIAPARNRGALAAAQQIAIFAGLLAGSAAAFLLARASGSVTAPLWGGDATWRWMFRAEAVPAILFLLGLLAIPESPRFLIARGRDAQARAVLARLLGAAAAETKCTDIRRSLGSERPPRFADRLDGRRVRPVVGVGVGLAAPRQLAGINVVFYFGFVLWSAAGLDESDALLQQALMGALSMLAGIVAVPLVDRIGRRPLLFWGAAGMALAVMAAMFASGTPGPGDAPRLSATAGAVTLVAGLAYMFLFGMGWGPVQWVVMGEVFPNRIRGAGVAVSGFSHWMSNLLVTLTFPLLPRTVGLAASFAVYALFALPGCLFALPGCLFALPGCLFASRVVPETRGVEPEDMRG